MLVPSQQVPSEAKVVAECLKADEIECNNAGILVGLMGVIWQKSSQVMHTHHHGLVIIPDTDSAFAVSHPPCSGI